MTDEETRNLVGLGGKLVGALPAQFLALLAINVLLVGGMFWHLESQLDARERVLVKLVDNCTKTNEP